MPCRSPSSASEGLAPSDHHRPRRSWLRSGAGAAIAIALLLTVATAPAHAWDARTIEGTPAEQRNTHTKPPPGDDQCSLGAPDLVWGLYDFSWACYAHDVCFQNHQLNGRGRSFVECNSIFLAKMYAECNSRHSWWNPKRNLCRRVARRYWGVVTVGGLPSWNSWNGPPG